MALINCPNCNNQTLSTAKRCVHCRSEITVCPTCMEAFVGDVTVCDKCGTPLSNDGTENNRNATEIKLEKNDVLSASNYVMRNNTGYKVFKVLRVILSILFTFISIAIAIPMMLGTVFTAFSSSVSVNTAIFIGFMLMLVTILIVNFPVAFLLDYTDRFLMFHGIKKFNCNNLLSVKETYNLMNAGAASRKGMRTIVYCLDSIFLTNGSTYAVPYCIMEVISVVCATLALLVFMGTMTIPMFTTLLPLNDYGAMTDIDEALGGFMIFPIILIIDLILMIIFNTVPNAIINKIKSKQLIKLEKELEAKLEAELQKELDEQEAAEFFAAMTANGENTNK